MKRVWCVRRGAGLLVAVALVMLIGSLSACTGLGGQSTSGSNERGAAHSDSAGHAVVDLATCRVVAARYDAKDVEVAYSEDSDTNTVTARLYRLGTNDLLATYRETPEMPLRDVEAALKNGAGEQTFTTTLSQSVTVGAAGDQQFDALVSAKVNIAMDGSSAQITKVYSVDQQPLDAAQASIDMPITHNLTNGMPTQTIKWQAGGTLEVVSSADPAVERQALEDAGYTCRTAYDGSWTARHDYEVTAYMEITAHSNAAA